MDFEWVAFGLIVAWAFALAACLGSFLNVVVYRLPLGRSLSRPASSCPQCGARIRGHDNVPIFAWFWLGGKCRDCAAPIPPRYPAVEAGFALAVAAFVASELAGEWRRAFVLGEWFDPSSLFFPLGWRNRFFPWLILHRTLLLFWAAGVTLMDHDGCKPPRRFVLLGGMLGVGMVVLMPSLHRSTLALVHPSVLLAPTQIGPTTVAVGLMVAMVGGAAAVTVAWLFTAALYPTLALVTVLMLAGVFVGAAGVVVVSLGCAAILGTVRAMPIRPRGSVHASAAVAALWIFLVMEPWMFPADYLASWSGPP